MQQTENLPKGKKRWTIMAFLLLLVVMTYLSMAEDTVDIEQGDNQAVLQQVAIRHIHASAETASISAYATLKPRWSAELKSAVSGKVQRVLDHALVGEAVNQQDDLIVIDDTLYVVELSAAEMALEEARKQLLEAKSRTMVARQQFKNQGRKPSSPLSTHLPDLMIAKKALVSAKSRVALAQQNLSHTRVKAPFTGIVSERYVSPGQTVNVGDALLKLIDNRHFDITVTLNAHDWRLLLKPVAGLSAQLLDVDGKVLGQASVRQGGDFLDEKTRQYQLFLTLDKQQAESALADAFVQVQLPGIVIDSALKVPTSAITQNGYVWYVDKDERLRRFVPNVLFYRQQHAVIDVPAVAAVESGWRIVLHPFAAFLPGQQVAAKLEE